VETCRNKKEEEPTVAITEITTHDGKPPRSLNYPCHICGIMGHKLTNCPRFKKMQNMFKDKGGQCTNLSQQLRLKWILPLSIWWMSMLPLEVRQMKNKCLKIERQRRTNMQ
jgi:hypothetical protein